MEEQTAKENANQFGKWPFSEGELTAGLRRHSGDPRLKITAISEREITQRRPAIGQLRGIEVQADGSSGAALFTLVLKENMGSTRVGSAGAGVREVNIYLTFKDHLPLKLPTLICAHPRGEWLVMLHLPVGRLPDKWSAADYLLGAEQLAILHDRFWGLDADLSTYPWLEQPLDASREIYLKGARDDAEKFMHNRDGFLATTTDLVSITERIIDNIDLVSAALKDSTATLLHGDYWPGNVLIHQQSGVTVYDWENAAIGPGVLDLLSFIQSSSWWFSPLPLPPDEIAGHYRTRLAQAGAHNFSNDEFNQLWDLAVMWTFITGWAGRLARTPDTLLPMRLEAIQQVVISPLVKAVERQLP
jgi:hypothetical protein